MGLGQQLEGLYGMENLGQAQAKLQGIHRGADEFLSYIVRSFKLDWQAAFVQSMVDLVLEMQNVSAHIARLMQNFEHYILFSERHRLNVATNSLGFLGVLPPEILQHILQFLGPKELLRRVPPLNRHLNELTNDNALWKAMCRKHIPSHPVEMEFWFLKRVEKEALLNQGGKLGKHHSRLNSARSRERASSASSSSQPFASGSADEEAAALDDRGESSNDDIVALNASSNSSINAVGDNDNDDNKSSNSNNDEESSSRDERAGAVALMPSPQQRRATLSQSTNSSSSGSGPSEAVVADKKRDRDRNHPFYKEESDKSFLWGRAGPLSSCSTSTSTSLDPDAAANAGAASVLPPKIKSGWRGVFRKYHQLERNWKDGNCAVKTLVSRRRVYCILFSEEKQLLWSGNAKGTIKRLDLINYYPLREIKAHDSAINCLQTLENCNTSWDDENIAYRSRSRRGEQDHVRQLKSSREETREEVAGLVPPSNDSNDLLFSCSSDNTIKVWRQSIVSDEPLSVMGEEQGGHQGPVQMIKLCDDGNKLLSCSLDQTLKLFDVNTSTCIATLKDTTAVRCVQLDKQTGCIISGGSDGMIKLWDPRLKGKGDYAADSSGPVACVYRIPTGLGKVMCLQANNSKLFVGGDSDRKHNFPIFVYNLQKLTGVVRHYGKSLIPCTSSDSYAVLKEAEFMGHSDRIWTLQASLGRLVTGSRDGNVRVWNYSHCPNAADSVDKKESGSYILGKPHQRHSNSIYWLQFSSTRIVTASADHTIKIWNFA